MKSRRLLVAVPVHLVVYLPSWASAQTENFYLAFPPPETGPGTANFGVMGPIPQAITISMCSALDVGGVSPREEIVASDTTTVSFLDLDDAGGSWTVLQPQPPVPIAAMTAIDFTGTSALDLAVASDSDLYVLDLDVASPAWSGPMAQPVVLQMLASVDVGGVSTRPELVSSDATDILFLDLDAAGAVWQTLSPPTSGIDVIAAIELSVGTPSTPEDLLVAISGLDLYAFKGGQWLGPFEQRYLIATLTGIELVDRSSEEEGIIDTEEAVVVLEPAAPTLISFEDDALSAGLSGYVDPGGDGHCPGAIFADVDGDTFADLYLVRGDGSAGGGGNDLYINNNAGGFVLQPGALGANDSRSSAGALLADFDNDGDEDIYVINFNDRNTLYENQGGAFVDVTDASDPTPADPKGDSQEGVGVGVIPSGCGVGGKEVCTLDHTLAAAWADVDRDGDLDLFVGSHRCCGFPDGERDVLYANNGDGTFTDITVASRVAVDFPPGGALSTQSAVFADFNNDQWPDLYITHKDDGPGKDELFLNDGDQDGDQVWDGTFSDYLASQPPGSQLGEVSGAAMGIDVGDYDNDGDLDFYVADIGEMDFYKNLLAETGAFGLELLAGADNPAPGWYWSWGTNWIDVDNDGDLDLHVATQDFIMDYLYRNEGGGVFTDVALAAGVGQAWGARADVAADYDHDGWIDYLALNKGATPSALYRNTSGQVLGNHWLHVALVGDATLVGPFRSSRDALGARVTVVADTDGDGTIGAAESQIREVVSGSHSCASTSSLELEFGLGQAPNVQSVKVEWPSGRTTELFGVAVDQRLPISETAGACMPFSLARARLKLHKSSGAVTAKGKRRLTGISIDPVTDGASFLLDDDASIWAATVPAGQFQANSSGTTFKFRDKAGSVANGIQSMRLTLKSNGKFKAKLRAKGVDLSAADLPDIVMRLETGALCFAEAVSCNITAGGDRFNCKG